MEKVVLIDCAGADEARGKAGPDRGICKWPAPPTPTQSILDINISLERSSPTYFPQIFTTPVRRLLKYKYPSSALSPKPANNAQDVFLYSQKNFALEC